MSASCELFVFHTTQRCHSVFSCFDPPASFQERLVAREKVATRLPPVVERYVKKGDKLYVEGRIEYRQWQDKDGQTRYSTEINVRELIMLGGGKGGGGGDFDGAESAPRRAAPTASKAKAPAAGGEDFEDFPNALADEDDDLPF